MKLSAIFPNVIPEERSRLAFAVLGFMFVASTGVVSRTMGTTLFLDNYGPNYLSYMYVGTAILVTAASYLFGLLARGYSVARLIAWSSLSFVVMSVVLRLALIHPWGGFRMLAYFLSDIVSKVPTMLFWIFASLIFNPREGKRLFGFVGAGGTLACVAAGALVGPFANRFGTENLLWVVAFLILGFAVTGHLYGRQETARIEPRPNERHRGKHPSSIGYYAELLRTEQVRNLTLIVAVTTVALVVTDFQFKSAARAEYQGTALAGFLGTFYATTSLVALVVQLFFVHRVLERGGVFAAMSILPASLFVVSVGTALSGSFGWIVASKFVDPIFDFTVNSAAIQMLYVGIRKQSRGQARTLIDGFAKPCTMALAGLSLATAVGWMSFRGLAIVVAVTCLLWLILAWKSSRAYVRGLVESVGARRFDVSDEALTVHDKTLEEHIRRALLAAPDSEIPYLLGILPDLVHVEWTSEYRTLLQRESAEVKVAALNHLAGIRRLEDRPAILAHLEHPDPEVRKAAVRAASALGGEVAVEGMKKLLDDPEAMVRAAAAAELINIGDLEGLIAACVTIKAMLASSNSDSRIAAADGLAHIRHDGLTRPISILLEDSNPLVRQAALAACRQRPHPDLIPAILPLVGDPLVASAASETLVAFGPGILEHLGVFIESAKIPEAGEKWHRIPAILAQIGDPVAIPFLEGLLDTPDLWLRREVIDAYCQLLRHEKSLKPHIQNFENAIRREIAEAISHFGLIQALVEIPATKVLCDALREEYMGHLENCFTLIGVRTAGVDSKALFHTIHLESPDRRAEALEILDNVLEGDIKLSLLGHLERSRARVVPPARSYSDQIAEILGRSTSDWVATGALYAAGENQLDVLIPRIRTFLDHPVSHVRETALDALGKVDRVEILLEACKRLEFDPSGEVRGLAETLARRVTTKGEAKSP